MAGDDLTDNAAINDPLHQYRVIFGVPSRRRIFFAAACIFFVLTLIVITFALMSKPEISKNIRLPYPLFRQSLNISVDPCVDFYAFTCGLWEQNNPITEDFPRVTSFGILQKKINEKKKTVFENAQSSDVLPRVVNSAIHFYNKCVQLSNSYSNDGDVLLKFFEQIGGWPIFHQSNWNESSFDLLHASALFIKNLDVHTFIGVYSTDNAKIDGRNVIYLKEPTLLNDVDLTLDEYTFMQMMYVIVRSLNNSIVDDGIDEDIENLKLAADKWRELLSLPFKVSDATFMTIEELSTEVPKFDWLKYLQLITNDTLVEVNETLTLEDMVAVDDLDYLKKVIDVVTSDIFTKRDLANLFGWFAIKDILILIPNVLLNYGKATGYDSSETISAAKSKCYDLVLELFPCSLDYIYVKNASHAGIEDNKILTNYLKDAFQDIIERSPWLDEITRNSILHRISNMKSIIGFPSYLNNKTEFDEVYREFPNMREYGLGYYFQVSKFFVKMRILQYKIKISWSKDILPRHVSDVSAYYIYHQNSLVYPISLLNPPFYYFEGPWYLNFGAIGSVIGHEMMHGVDCTGTQGNHLNVSWFSDEALTLYKERASCFKEQYSVYDSSGMFKNNGTRTLRENIADSEGLHLAFEAYKKHQISVKPSQMYRTLDNYTPDQMFFIAFGTVWCSKIKPYVKEGAIQMHSLPDIRVNKAVSNSESFAQAFNCPERTPMNPSEKCLVW